MQRGMKTQYVYAIVHEKCIYKIRQVILSPQSCGTVQKPFSPAYILTSFYFKLTYIIEYCHCVFIHRLAVT